MVQSVKNYRAPINVYVLRDFQAQLVLWVGMNRVAVSSRRNMCTEVVFYETLHWQNIIKIKLHILQISYLSVLRTRCPFHKTS